MPPENKEKLAVNVTNSWKMASNWVMTASGVLFAAYLSLPAKCPPEMLECASQAVVLSHLPVPAWAVPLIGTLIGIVARLWPQSSITPAVAEAKSADPE